MRQLELRRVECLPRQALQDFVTEANVRSAQAQHLFPSSSIHRIPHHGVTQVGEMDAYLMCTPSVEPNFQTRGEPEALLDAPMRPGRLAAAARHRHAAPITRIAGNGGLDRARTGAGVAPYQGLVDAMHLARANRLDQRPVGPRTA